MQGPQSGARDQSVDHESRSASTLAALAFTIELDHELALTLTLTLTRVCAQQDNQCASNKPNSTATATSHWEAPQHHHDAPDETKRAVETIVSVRSLEPSSLVSQLPEQVLFQIFSYL